MKALILAIQAALRDSGTLDYVRDKDIFVSGDELILPMSVRFPAIGIKDGEITYKASTQDQDADILRVRIAAYVRLDKDEASIMGDSSSSLKGVLDVMADIRSILRLNRLSGTVDVAWPDGETESVTLAADGDAIQRKILLMRYEKY